MTDLPDAQTCSAPLGLLRMSQGLSHCVGHGGLT